MGDKNELKPCPFCGGEGFASPRTCDRDTPYNPSDRAYPVVRCGKCFTTVGGKDWSDVRTAIDAWNLRATSTPPADAALADAIRAVRDIVRSAYDDGYHDGKKDHAGSASHYLGQMAELIRVDQINAALRARQPAQSVAVPESLLRESADYLHHYGRCDLANELRALLAASKGGAE